MKGKKGRTCIPVPGLQKDFKGQLAYSFFPPAKRKPIWSQSMVYSGAPWAGRLGRAAQVPAAPGLLSAARGSNKPEICNSGGAVLTQAVLMAIKQKS